VLQEGEVRPVGAKDVLKVDVRIISASNKDLQQLVEKGKFRKDLYYRINVITIRTPALREHREDIPELAEHFLDKVAAEYKMPRRELAPDVLGVLAAYDWPGNIREFENEIYRVVALSDGIITSDLLSSHIQKAKEAAPEWTKTYERINEQTLKKAVAKVERQVIAAALKKTSGNQTKAAKMLGLSRFGLRKKMDRCGFLLHFNAAGVPRKKASRRNETPDAAAETALSDKKAESSV